VQLLNLMSSLALISDPQPSGLLIGIWNRCLP
jgi:hypothetical protein